MARARIISAAVVLAATGFFVFAQIGNAQLLDDRVWVGGTGSQLWQVDANWNPIPFPNDPGRVDPDMTIITPVVGANLSVNLAANLSVDVGATDVTVASLTIGSTSGGVTTNITSSGGRLVFENFESNNTAPEPDICAFNCGAALITSQGVAGATNTVSAVVGVNDALQFAGTKDLTLAGGVAEMGSSATLSSMTSGRTLFITGNITTNDTSVSGGADDTPLILNDNGASLGTIDVVGAITGAGRMRYGTAASAPTLPLGTVILRNNNTYSGRTLLGRGNVRLANNNALGTADVKQEGPAAGSLETGYNFISDNDSRKISNNMIIGQWQSVKGTNSLEWAGRVYQTNARGWINMLPSDKTLTLSGQQFTFEVADGDLERILTFDGTGKTRITRGIHNRWDSVANAEAINSQPGAMRVRGSGVVIVDGDDTQAGSDSNFTGSIYVQGGNLHFANNADYGIASAVASEAGAVGIDSGVVTNSAFLALINSSANPAADAAGNLVVYDRGGLMLGSSEYGSNLDFTGDLANASGMSLAAHENGSSYTGTITPANATYRFGGGKGTLSLPNANQLTGARSVVVTNGGEVNIPASNNYTGATSVVAKFVTTLQNAAAADTISFTDGDNIPNDQVYLGTTLTVTTVANGGTSSSIGSSTNAAANLYIQGSTLKYVGSGASTDRLFTVGSGGATIESSGSGALSFTNAGTLAIDIAESRTGNVNAFAVSGNTAANRTTVRNIGSTEDLQIGMPISSPGLPLTGDGGGIPAGTVITRIAGPNDVVISNPVGNFAFYNNTPITFGAAPERKLTLTGSNSGNNSLASLVANASDGGVVGVTKNGTGKWILTGNNTYTGTTTVNAGTLLVNGNQTGAGLTTVVAGATLGGTGTLGGALTNNGTVNPGASVGTLNVNGNVLMGAASHYAVELSGATADKLAITGNLDLSALANFLDVTGPGTGSSWVIATYTGTLTGAFETITSGYTVDYGTGTNSQVTLMAGAPGLPGDFNSDGKVDAGDYVTWRKNNGTSNALANDNGLGTPIGPSHYTLWRNNFGNPPGSGSGLGGGAVPEPSSIVLIGLALVATIGGVRRRG